MYEGYGKEIYENGDYYEGEFKNGLKNGRGILYTKHHNIQYKGDWINNDINGYGIQYFKNGQKYEGELKDGLRNGKGTIYYKNGDIQYKGNLINEKPDGYGKYILRMELIMKVNLKMA